MSSLKEHIEQFEKSLLKEANDMQTNSERMFNGDRPLEKIEEESFGFKDIKELHNEELKEKDRIIENLKQELKSQWLTNKTAFNTKKMYEDKNKKMDIVDSTNLIPTLMEVSKQKQGNVKLDWMSWLEIPESNYLFQINESLAKKVFQENNIFIDKNRYELRGRRGRGGDAPTAVDTDYILTFAGDTVDDFVETTFNPDNYDGTGTGLNHGFTVSFWIKPDEIGGFKQALGRRSETNGRFHFGIKSATLVHVGVGQSNVKDGNTHNDGVETGHGMEVGNWYNVVVTYGGDDHTDIGGDRNVRMWKNGKAITKTGATGGGMGISNWQPSWTNSVNDASNVYFGARTDFNGLPGDVYSQGWACSLSEIAIYKTETDDDGTFANEVYNAGWGYDHRNNSNLVGYWRLNEGKGTRVEDLSGNGNHGTLTTEGTGIPTWTKNESYT